jgi:hypothetical protein
VAAANELSVKDFLPLKKLSAGAYGKVILVRK